MKTVHKIAAMFWLLTHVFSFFALGMFWTAIPKLFTNLSGIFSWSFAIFMAVGVSFYIFMMLYYSQKLGMEALEKLSTLEEQEKKQKTA